MEGLQTLAERNDHVFNALLEQFRGLSTRQQATMVNPRYSVTPLLPSLPCLPSLEPYVEDLGTCQMFLSQCSIIFELQLSLFPSVEDSVHDNTHVREGTRLCYTGVEATIHSLPQSGGVCGGG